MMFCVFLLVLGTQQEQFLQKIEGFNLTQYVTCALPGVCENAALYLPHFFWLPDDQFHSTRTTHYCPPYGPLCFSISNGERGRSLFFNALHHNKFDRWVYGSVLQECGSPSYKVQHLDHPEICLDIFCYGCRLTGRLNPDLFVTCQFGEMYYRQQHQRIENLMARGRRQQRGIPERNNTENYGLHVPTQEDLVPVAYASNTPDANRRANDIYHSLAQVLVQVQLLQEELDSLRNPRASDDQSNEQQSRQVTSDFGALK